VQAEAHNATTALDRREQLLSSVAGLVERADSQVDAVDEATAVLTTARSSLSDAEGALQPLAARVQETTRQLEAARRTDSAAFAAHGCHPGDECPVCARALPDTWAPPAAADLDAARGAVEDAENSHKKAAEECRRAGDRRGKAVGHLRSTLESLASTLGELATLATDHKLAPPPLPDTNLVPDMSADDATFEATGRGLAALPISLAAWFEAERQRLSPLLQNRDEAQTKLERSATELQEAVARQGGADAGAADLKSKVAGAEATRNSAAEEPAPVVNPLPGR
jgi:exonuclease SbcC